MTALRQIPGELVERLNAFLGTLEPSYRDVNGFLHAEGHVAKPGVIDYADVGGPRELTPPEILFEPLEMASLIGMPIVDAHPSEGLVTPQTARLRQLGSVVSVRRDGDFLAASMVITDGDLADDVEAREKVELSAGMRCTTRPQDGIWRDGERYNAVRGLGIYNHLAVVPRGRCSSNCGTGPCGCAIRTNSAGGSPVGGIQMATKQVHRTNAAADPSASDPAMEAAMLAYPDDVKAAMALYKSLVDWKQADGDEDDPMPVADLAAPAAAVPAAPRMNAEAAQWQAERTMMQAQIKALQKAVEGQVADRANAVAQAAGEHSEVLEQMRLLGGREYRANGKSAHSMRLEGLGILNAGDEGYLAEIKGYSPETLKATFDTVMRVHPVVLAARANASVGIGAGAQVLHLNAPQVDSLSEAEAIANGRMPSQVVNGRRVRVNS